jgi:quercetin dioxygenase-like cupin family protein
MHKKSVLRSAGWLLLLSGSAGIAADSAPPTASVPPGFVEWPGSRIPWQPLPAIDGGEIALLLGKPTEAGPIVMRVRLWPNTQVAAHTHPEARTYTVLDGEWKLGFGDKYNAAILRSYTAGSVYRLPAKVPHFQATGPTGATVQIESIGPTRTQFIEATSEPR